MGGTSKGNRSLNVLVVQRIFSDYRRPIFDELSKNYNLLLAHGVNTSGISQIKTSYSKRVFSFKYWRKETNMYLNLFSVFFSFKPNIVIHEFNPSIISLHITFLLRKVFGYQIVVWGHGFNHKKGFNPKNSVTDKIRLFYLKKSDSVLVYTESIKKALSVYIPTNKIFVATNTLNTRKLIDIRKELDKIGLHNLKKELNFTCKYNFVFIGRLLKDKLPELLIKIFIELPFEIKRNTMMHFIGDGEMVNEIKEEIQALRLENHFRFHGKISDNRKNGKLLYASDLMLLPGYVGLSINHAFCFLCPVITFQQGLQGPFHSPEIEYLTHRKTGFLAKTFDIKDYSSWIVEYLSNEDLQVEIKNNIQNLIENNISIDQMIAGFNNCIHWVISNSKDKK